jgi:RNA polymerase sigma-70 factor (ECF subfamily)
MIQSETMKNQCRDSRCEQVRDFLEGEGRQALLGYFRKRSPWHVAEDLAQDAFVKAWTGCGTLRDPRRSKAWLFGIARNRLVDHFRRLRVEGTDLAQVTQSGEQDRGGEALAFREAMAGCLRENLSMLPPEQQSVVAALLEGERQVDIALRLGVPLSTVKTRTQRARRNLLEYATSQCEMTRDAFGRVVGCEPKGSTRCVSGDS